MTPVQLSQSRAVPVPVDEAFDRVLAEPLPAVFRRRSLAIPPIKDVRGQKDAWDTAGQARTIVLADGGTMRETLTQVERPHLFGYRIDEITGAMKPLVSSVTGRWNFEPVGTGTRITWEWDLTPTTPGRVTMPVFTAMWNSYARKALENIEHILLR